MGVAVNWQTEGEIIHIHFCDRVTLDEITEANERAFSMKMSSAATTHIIVDVRDVTTYPMNLIRLRSAIRHVDSEKLGILILVTRQHSILSFIGTMLVQMFALRDHWRVVETMDEALAIVSRVQTT
jgi:hypothetical protein